MTRLSSILLISALSSFTKEADDLSEMEVARMFDHANQLRQYLEAPIFTYKPSREMCERTAKASSRWFNSLSIDDVAEEEEAALELMYELLLMEKESEVIRVFDWIPPSLEEFKEGILSNMDAFEEGSKKILNDKRAAQAKKEAGLYSEDDYDYDYDEEEEEEVEF